ncbi:SAM-dependent methyltransferase [Nocardiopsis ansamitocini]|uniref:S-adenosyl methyltransferase n=1 Tax=Nocardiopsis ansamitocini TaxID=1670832 RepID=A0A9W6UFX1_9ACTN|nr:SAM-dependent methyltransferase [Nocardiopsis ansamitocini]GLU46021.1 hypothetical protein Nans01_03720 [Nocardiopsis ansamitocini]
MTDHRTALRADVEPPLLDVPGPRVVHIVDYLRDAPAVTPPDPAVITAVPGFLRRCVGYLATDLGIGQFVDIGSGVPAAEGVHGVARTHDPDSRVVYVDTGAAASVGSRTAVHVDGPVTLHVKRLDAAGIAGQLGLRGLLDLTSPLGVVLNADALPGDNAVGALVRGLYEILAPGSHLVICRRPPNDADPHARQRAATLFEPFDLLEPGTADIAWWPYPDDEVAATGTGVLAGVARRP